MICIPSAKWVSQHPKTPAPCVPKPLTAHDYKAGDIVQQASMNGHTRVGVDGSRSSEVGLLTVLGKRTAGQEKEGRREDQLEDKTR